MPSFPTIGKAGAEAFGAIDVGKWGCTKDGAKGFVDIELECNGVVAIGRAVMGVGVAMADDCVGVIVEAFPTAKDEFVVAVEMDGVSGAAIAEEVAADLVITEETVLVDVLIVADTAAPADVAPTLPVLSPPTLLTSCSPDIIAVATLARVAVSALGRMGGIEVAASRLKRAELEGEAGGTATLDPPWKLMDKAKCSRTGETTTGLSTATGSNSVSTGGGEARSMYWPNELRREEA